MPKELPEATYIEIKELCKQGDELVKRGELDEALERYISAMKLLPGPNPNEWTAATWIYVAIGDVKLRQNKYDIALESYIYAVQCPKGLGNPYIHLRLGQCYFEVGHLDKAADELTRAYMGAGLGIFMEDDYKYLEFLETKILIA
jgi:tetratricopeptide (TPR) repeat protein